MTSIIRAGLLNLQKHFVCAYSGMTKKARSCVGFTLTEVLATVVVVGLVSGGLATAVSVGTKQFTRSMAMSESQQLFSMLRQDMDNDLKYATQYLPGDDEFHVTGYISPHHGDKDNPLYLCALDDKGEVAEPTNSSLTGLGQLALCSENRKVKNRLLGKGSYNYDLRARVNSFTYDDTKKTYVIDLEIVQASLNESLVHETFSVRALNEVSTK